MNETIKILILEDDKDERTQFEQSAKNIDGIRIIGNTANADEALEIAQKEDPDAIIIDLELHDGTGNGLQFLSDLQTITSETTPFLLVTTNNSSRTTHEASRALGADFILTKYESDYSADYVMNFLKMMHATMHNTVKETFSANTKTPGRSFSRNSAHRENNDKVSAHNIPEAEIVEYIRNELILIGISPKAVGFQYLVDAIFIKLKDSNANIYAIIGPKYKKSDPSIERAMQYAINRAWRTGDPDELLELYTARINAERGVPTIMEFVYFYISKTQNYFKIR